MGGNAADSRLGRLDRRRFLWLSGATALGGLLAACDRRQEARPSTGGSTPNPATQTGDVALRHDAGVGPQFEPYIKDFNKRYEIELSADFVPQDYFGVTQTALAGGDTDFDVLFGDPAFTQKWAAAGWIRAIDDFPGVDELLKATAPGTEELLRSNDGRLVALPYFVGMEMMAYNADHLSRINADPPTTWDEFMEQCRELKSKGVVSTPASPFWGQEFDIIWWSFISEVMSEGGQVFDGLEPVFADDPAVRSTLERWKSMFDEGLVAQDIFTTSYGDLANIFAGGKSTFTIRYGQQFKGWTDPEQSKVAESAKLMLLPGSTQETYRWLATWHMAAGTEAPDPAWTVLLYLAFKDLDGEFYVPTNLIAKDFALLTPYPEVNNSPAVTESIQTWADPAVVNSQFEKSRVLGSVENQVWLAEFRTTLAGILQEIIRGDKATDEGLAEAVDFVNSKA